MIRRYGYGTWESGVCLNVLKGHTDYVRGVALTPDARKAISGSWDKMVRVWDLESGVCLNVLEGHTNYVFDVALTPDGRKAIWGVMIRRSGCGILIPQFLRQIVNLLNLTAMG